MLVCSSTRLQTLRCLLLHPSRVPAPVCRARLSCTPTHPRNRYAPYAKGKSGGKCKICKSTLHQEGLYCHGCAYSKG